MVINTNKVCQKIYSILFGNGKDKKDKKDKIDIIMNKTKIYFKKTNKNVNIENLKQYIQIYVYERFGTGYDSIFSKIRKQTENHEKNIIINNISLNIQLTNGYSKTIDDSDLEKYTLDAKKFIEELVTFLDFIENNRKHIIKLTEGTTHKDFDFNTMMEEMYNKIKSTHSRILHTRYLRSTNGKIKYPEDEKAWKEYREYKENRKWKQY